MFITSFGYTSELPKGINYSFCFPFFEVNLNIQLEIKFNADN